MKFSVARNTIYKALQKIIGVVPVKTTSPILTNILFELEDNHLKLTATDLEILTSTSLEVNGEENGVICIPAKFLNEIIRELGNEEIRFEQEDGYRIKLSTDRGEFRIVGDPGADFPLMPVEENMKGFEIEEQQIHRMIEKTIFAVSMDELRAALMGVLFQISSNELRLVGTDGHRLSRIIKRNFRYDGEDTEFIVPTKALSLLNKNIEQSGGNVKIEFSKNYVVFELEYIRVYSRLVESEYPDYDGVIPKNNTKQLVLNTDFLIASIRRVSIFSSTLTHQIQISLESNKVEVSSQDIDVGGEGREDLDGEFEGDPLDIAFNSQYFLDVLKHVDTEQTRILLDTSITATMILPMQQKENEDLLMLLMPVRLNEYYETENSAENKKSTIDESSFSVSD